LRRSRPTRYHAVVDPAQLGAQASKNAGPATLFDGLTEQSGLADVPVDVWLDADGLVRKLVLAFEATDPDTARALGLRPPGGDRAPARVRGGGRLVAARVGAAQWAM
jgi:hypothetical protein